MGSRRTKPVASSSRGTAPSVVRACHRLAALGFVASTDGNISVRLDDRHCLITASGTSFADLRASGVLRMRFDAPGTDRRRLRPSSEAALHIALYRRDASIGAVVHAHPPHATAFAAAGSRLTPNVFPEVVLDLGDVPLVRYVMPSSEQLGALVARYTDTGHAALLANHGAVTWGHSLEEAVRRMEKLEHAATVELYARALGGVRQLTHEQVAELRSHHPLSPWKNG